MSGTAVTVVMPAWNTASTITSAIRSVLAQPVGDLELIVVDDGSSDATVERAEAVGRADPRVRVLRRAHRGVAAARGTGLEAARGELIAMIDSDDLWMPDYLGRMTAALAASPDAGWAYTDAWHLDTHRRRVRRVSAMGHQHPPDPPPSSAPALFRALLARNFVFNSVTLRRTVLDAVGPPDTRLRSMVDWEWWLRMSAAGCHGIAVPGRLAVYRRRAESISGDPILVAEGQRDLWRLLAEEYRLPEETRVRLRRRVERLDAEVGALRGDRLLPRLRQGLKTRTIALRDLARARRDFYPEPPEELRRAFGDLVAARR